MREFKKWIRDLFEDKNSVKKRKWKWIGAVPEIGEWSVSHRERQKNVSIGNGHHRDFGYSDGAK